MFGKKKSIVGLDIGAHSVKAVEITEANGDLKITGFGAQQILNQSDTREAISTVLKENGIKNRHVVTAVSGRSVIVRYVNMVNMSDDDLKSALRFEADKYIPFDIDEVVLDCQRLETLPSSQDSDSESEMKVLLIAVKRTLIDEYVNILNDVGLIPLAIDFDSFAIGNAFELCSQNSSQIEDDDRVIALIDIGASKTEINIMRGNLSCFSREVYLAGNDFTEAICRRLNISEKEAEQIKIAPNEKGEDLEEAVLPILDDLGNEVHLSFDYYENQFDQQVEEIFISGGSSGIIGLESSFERIFNRKISFWDPTENMEVKSDRVDVDTLKATAPRLPVAVGLATRMFI